MSERWKEYKCTRKVGCFNHVKKSEVGKEKCMLFNERVPWGLCRYLHKNPLPARRVSKYDTLPMGQVKYTLESIKEKLGSKLSSQEIEIIDTTCQWIIRRFMRGRSK